MLHPLKERVMGVVEVEQGYRKYSWLPNLFTQQHSSSVNEQLKGSKCKCRDWEWRKRETDGERECVRERGKKERGNHHRRDEWGWWQKPSGDHSVTETGFCGPNFIIMTQSHQHTPSDKSTAEFSSRNDQLNWSGFSGLSQIERMTRSCSGFRSCQTSVEMLTWCSLRLHCFWGIKYSRDFPQVHCVTFRKIYEDLMADIQFNTPNYIFISVSSCILFSLAKNEPFPSTNWGGCLDHAAAQSRLSHRCCSIL